MKLSVKDARELYWTRNHCGLKRYDRKLVEASLEDLFLVEEVIYMDSDKNYFKVKVKLGPADYLYPEDRPFQGLKEVEYEKCKKIQKSVDFYEA